MRMYSLLIPINDNQGTAYTSARGTFEALALEACGGFTNAGQVTGRWRGPDGKIVSDVCYDYRLACDGPTFQTLLDAAHVLFDDQAALMACELGEAWLSEPARKVA